MENIKANTIISLVINAQLKDADLITLDALKSTVKKIKDQFKINKDTIFEPEKSEDERVYNGHIELDITFKNLEEMFSFIYDFAPTSFEIYSPELLEIPAPVFTGELNALTGTILNVTNMKQGLEYSLKTFCKSVLEILEDSSQTQKKLLKIRSELEKYYVPARQNEKK